MLPAALEYLLGYWNGFCVYRPASEGRLCEHFGGYKTTNWIPLPLVVVVIVVVVVVAVVVEVVIVVVSNRSSDGVVMGNNNFLDKTKVWKRIWFLI